MTSLLVERWLSPSRLAQVAAAAMLVAAALGSFVGDAVSFHYPQLVISVLVLVAWWKPQD